MQLETALAKVVLVVGAGIVGWYVSRRWRLRNPSQPLSPSRDYFAGLNFLANEQPDRALEAFLRAVEVDKDTVETHLALGALYRRRGEVDRAIRVHQNLMARPNLDPMHREQATYALAQDYLRAGLLDRAEKLMLQISEAGTYRIAALRDLVSIYELQRDWERAIAVHRQLARVANPPQPSAVAHYFCELAEGFRAQGDLNAAQQSLRSARGELRRFPRSALIRADIAVDLGQTDLALKLLRETAEAHPQLASEVLPRLTRALRAAGREKDLGAALESAVVAAPALRQPLALALIAQGELESPLALAIVREYVAAEPGIGEVVAALRPGESQLDDASLRRLCDALRRQTVRNARYRCSECGFASTTFFWQCPGCKGWDSLRSLAYVDLTPASGTRRSGRRAEA